MANLGELFYSLGVKEDAQLDKKLAEIKKKLSGLKIEISVDKSALETLTKLSNSAQIISDVNKKLGLSATQLASQQNKNTVAAARAAAIQQAANDKTLISQQKVATESERTAIAHERLRQATERASNAQKNLSSRAAFTNKTFTDQRVIAYQLANMLGQVFSIYAVGAFIKKLAEVRGEFELQQVALRAITRDKEAADAIFSQVKTLSVKSPFTFSELLRDTKQLAAFSVETDKLFSTLTRLADVSAGLGVDMNRIILAYGQVRAATVLRGQELRQFTEAGIPIIDMLANKFTKLEGTVVSAGDVFKRISEKMVSFKDVDEIFTQLTSSGGMFFEMQKKQSETLAGKLANLKDAYMIMLNGIGEANDGILKGGADMLYKLMNNWEGIVRVLKTVVITYGAYKAILLAVSIQERIHNAILVEAIAVRRASTLGQAGMSAATAVAIARTNILTGAMVRLNTVMKASLWVAAISALIAIGTYAWGAYQKTHQLEESLNKINKEEGSNAKAQILHIDILVDRLKKVNDGSKERKQIISELNNVASPYLKNLLTESMSYDKIKEALVGVNNAIYENAKAKAYEAASNKVTEQLSTGITDAEKGIREALMSEGLQGELSSIIIGRLFGDIQNNPEIAKNKKSLITYIDTTISELRNKGFDIPKSLSASTWGNILSSIRKFADLNSDAKKSMDDFSYSLSTWNAITDNTPESIKKIRKATEEEVLALENGINGAKKDIEIRDRKVKGLLEEADAYEKLGMYSEAANKKRIASSLDPQIDMLGRLKVAVEGLKEFKDSKINIGLIFGENQDYEAVSKNIIEKVKETEERYRSLAAVKKTISDPVQLEAAKKEAAAYKAIAEQLLGWTDKKAEKAEESALVKSIQADIAVIKEAQKAYEDYQKIMSKSDARAKVQSDYPGIAFETAGVVEKYKSFYDLLGKESSDAAIKEKAAIKKDINDIGKEGLIDSFKKVIDEAKAFVDANKDKFDLYKMIEDATGDRQMAMEISFGVDFKDKNIFDVLNQQILDLSTKLGVKVGDSFKNGFVGVSFEDVLSKTNLGQLPKEVQDQFKAAFDALKAYGDSEYKDSLTRTAAIIKEYGSSEAKKVAIKTEFAKKIADADANVYKLSDKEKADTINNLKAAEIAAISEVDATAFRLSKTYQDLFSDMEKYSVGRIKSIIEANEYIINQTKGQKAIDGKFTVSDLAGMVYEVPEKEINGLIKQITKLKTDLSNNDPFLKIAEGLRLIKAGGEDGVTGFIMLAQGLDAVIGMVAPLSDALAELGKATENAGMKNFAKDLELAVSWGRTFANLATALATENPAAIIGSLVEVTTKLIKAEADYQEVKQRYLLENIKLQYEYNNLLMAERLQFTSGVSIFGTNELGKVTNAMSIYRDAVSQAIAEQNKLSSATIAIDPKKIKFLGVTIGYEPVYADLLKTEKELINTDGTLNINRAKALLATDRLTDSTRQLLQQLIDLDQVSKDAYAQMTEYLTNVFGQLGQELSDSIVKAFEDGTDASLAFKTNVEGVIEKLTSDLLYSMLFTDYFKKYQAEIIAVYADKGTTEKQKADLSVEIMDRLFAGFGVMQERGNAILENMQASAGKYGFDIFKPNTPASAGITGEIKGVSEDTSRMLASILNGVYGLVGTQGITLKSIEGILTNTGNVTANGLAQLVLIQSNTYQTAQLLKSVIGGKGSQGDGIRVWA